MARNPKSGTDIADPSQQAHQGSETAIATVQRHTHPVPTIPPWHRVKQKKAVRSPSAVARRIHFMTGKGGGGKTTLANLMGSVAFYGGQPVEIYDLCVANPSARRLFKLPLSHVRGSLDKNEIGQTVIDTLYPHLATQSVIGDLGASVEVPLLDFLQENQLLEFLGEQILFHVLIGPLDSVGTARSIATRAPETPVVLYLNHRDAELRMVLDDPKRRAMFDELVALPNIVALLELPDMTTALAICSRVSSTLHDATTHPDLSVIERALCSGAMKRVVDLVAPIKEWLP